MAKLNSLMKFLQRYYKFFRNILLRINSLPVQVGNDERVTRFIFSSSHFSKTEMRVKPAAFLPATLDNKASVYRTSGCDCSEIWEIDRKFVTGKRKDGLQSKARADLVVVDIRNLELDVVSAPHVHYRHANIEKYSLVQSENKLKAIELAKIANLSLKQSAS